jgi:hypothetical protein
LSGTPETISKSWKQLPPIIIAKADPDGYLWITVKASIDDCSKSLRNLDGVVNYIEKESFFGQSFLRKPAKSIRLNRKTKDILVPRQQVQSYSVSMQSALQMINVYVVKRISLAILTQKVSVNS